MSEFTSWHDAAKAQAYADALELVGFQRAKEATIGLFEELTAEQRELAELMASGAEFKKLWGWAFPDQQWKVRRWVGLDPPGVLERVVAHQCGDQQFSEPLWRAMHRHNDGADGMKAFFESLDLPIADRLDVFADIYRGAYNLKLRTGPPQNRLTWGSPREVTGELGEWAARTAAALTAGGHGTTGLDIKWPVFLALARSGTDIDPAWDWLLPAGYGDEADLTRECADAIEPHRRAAAVRAAVRSLTFAPAIVRTGLALLSTHPSATLTRLVLEYSAAATKGTDAIEKSETLAELDEIGARHDVVARVLAAYREDYTVPTLSVVQTLAPTSVDELSVEQREQLRVAGENYDSATLSAADRLAPDPDLESSFSGTLEIRTLADEAGTPRFDAFTYAGDSGTVFAHATTEVVAEIIQVHLECPDPGLEEALRLCLQARRP